MSHGSTSGGGVAGLVGKRIIASLLILVAWDVGLGVNYVIADKNVFTKIISKSTGLHHIAFNGFAKHHWQTGYYPVAYGWCLGLC